MKDVLWRANRSYFSALTNDKIQKISPNDKYSNNGK